jgi:hypothetical protein
VTLRTAGWIAGGVALATLAAAAYLFATGDSLAAIKLLVFVFFVPCLAAFAVGASTIVRRTGWYRQPSAVLMVAFVLGCELTLLPILVYLPWAPAHFPLSQMPFGLPILMWVGLRLVVGASILGVALITVEDWRKGDRGRAVAGLVMFALIGLLIAARIASR